MKPERPAEVKPELTYTNISEAEADHTMSMHDVRLHILSSGEHFGLKTRRSKVDPKVKVKS